MLSEKSANFLVAPFWYWPPIVAVVMGIGVVEAEPYVAPSRALGVDSENLVILAFVILVCASLIVVLRSERLEITPDEVIYHELWGNIRFNRSDILQLSLSPPISVVGFVFVQLKSKKRPLIVPRYFRNYVGWMNMLLESSLKNKASETATS